MMTHTLLKEDLAEIGRRITPVSVPCYAEVRRRLARRRDRRPNPCALVALPEDAKKKRRKARPKLNDGKLRGVAGRPGQDVLAWRAVEMAFDAGALREGRDYSLEQIKRICRRAFCDMDLLCLDLAEHRSTVKISHRGRNIWRFSPRFAAPRI